MTAQRVRGRGAGPCSRGGSAMGQRIREGLRDVPPASGTGRGKYSDIFVDLSVCSYYVPGVLKINRAL